MIDESKEQLTKYVMVFSGYYLVFMAIVNILAHGFNIDLGPGANMAMLVGAGYASAIKFVTDLKRAPSKKEKRLLSLGCILASFIISIIGAAIVFSVVEGGDSIAEFVKLFGALPMLAWVAIVIVVCGLYYLVLGLIFGWGAKKYAAKYVAT